MPGGPFHELGVLLKKITFKKLKSFLKGLFANKDRENRQHQPHNGGSTPQSGQHQQQGPQGAWSQGPPSSAQQSGQKPQQSNGPPAQHSVQQPSGHKPAQPQQGHVGNVPSAEPTPQELSSIAHAVSRLWALDVHRLEPSKDFSLNLQNTTKVYGQVDAAPQPLFAQISADLFQRYSTYARFYALLDNYHAHNGTAEDFTPSQISEQRLFLEEVMKTSVMHYCHQYLVAKKLAPASLTEFTNMLKSVWFDQYKRQVANDSSAFEHTFVGEIRDGQVIGFHNWIQFFVEEKKGSADYRGYILPRRRNGAQKTPQAAHLMSFQFSWHGEVKPVSTFFIGTSPEFEIALYTLIFLAGQEDNVVCVDNVEVNIKCHKFVDRKGTRLGSCFPICG